MEWMTSFGSWLEAHPLWAALLVVLALTVYSAIGNALASALRKRGYVEASEAVLRLTPLASSTRDKVLKYLVSALLAEVEKLELPPSAKSAIRAVRTYLALPEPPSQMPPGASEPPSQLDTIPSPPPPPSDMASMRRSGIYDAGRRLGILSVLVLSGCTAEDRARARAAGDVISTVGREVCEQLDGVTDDGWVAFACRAVQATGDVLSNMSTEDHLDASRPTGPPVIRMVRTEDAQAFAAAHGPEPR